MEQSPLLAPAQANGAQQTTHVRDKVNRQSKDPSLFALLGRLEVRTQWSSQALGWSVCSAVHICLPVHHCISASDDCLKRLGNICQGQYLQTPMHCCLHRCSLPACIPSCCWQCHMAGHWLRQRDLRSCVPSNMRSWMEWNCLHCLHQHRPMECYKRHLCSTRQAAFVRPTCVIVRRFCFECCGF